MDDSLYVEAHAAEDREEYLGELASEYGISEDIVYMLADMLGPNEDHDGLITALEDYTGGF